MNTRKAQLGIGILNLIFLAALAGFTVVMGLKLVPMYAESFKIDAALKSLIAEPDLAAQSKRDIALALARRLDIDDVRRITDRNYPEYVTITKQKKKVTIMVVYRAETALVGNLTLVADFSKKAQN